MKLTNQYPTPMGVMKHQIADDDGITKWKSAILLPIEEEPVKKKKKVCEHLNQECVGVGEEGVDWRCLDCGKQWVQGREK